VNDNLADLVAEVEETLRVEGLIPLHDFSWSARGLNRGLSEQEIGDLCQEAYQVMTVRHRFRLMWFDWPNLEPSAGRPADPDTPLDFDINTTGRLTPPLLALVPLAQLRPGTASPDS